MAKITTILPAFGDKKHNQLSGLNEGNQYLHLTQEEKDKINLSFENEILEETGYTLLVQDLTINADWIWIISNIQYTNPSSVVLNIPYAAVGYSRIDIVVCDTNNTFQRIIGEESLGTPVAPSILSNTIQATFFVVTDAFIEPPAPPTTSALYIPKSEKAALQINNSGAIGFVSLGKFANSSAIDLSGTITTVSGVWYQVSQKQYDGRKFTIRNLQNTNITILNNEVGIGRPFMFPDGQNFILKPNEIIEFVFKADGKYYYVGKMQTGFVPYIGATTDVDLGEFQLSTGQVKFDQTPTGAAGIGVLRWNDQDGTLDLGLKGGNVNLQIGQETTIRVVNKTGIALTEAGYQVVIIDGSQGQRLSVDLAIANGLSLRSTLGLVTEDIPNNQEGFVTSNGLVRGINTTGSLQGETWSEGDILYVSPTIPGQITNIRPTAPTPIIGVGLVVNGNPSQGSIYCDIQSGISISRLYDVSLSSPIESDILSFNATQGYWQNETISTVIGYTPADDSNVVHKTGAETIAGDKSFINPVRISNNTSLDGELLRLTDYDNNATEAGLTLYRDVPAVGFEESRNWGIYNSGKNRGDLNICSSVDSQGAPDKANPHITVKNDGRTGFGTDQPTDLVHIDGALKLRGLLKLDQNSNSTAIGINAGNLGSVTGNYNVSIGVNALSSVLGANNNIGIGNNALKTSTVGNNNIAIGVDAMSLSGVNTGNIIAIGNSAAKNTNGGRNIAIGASALTTNVSGFQNTAIGDDALRLSTSSRNVALGYHAGNLLTGGLDNVILGWDAQASITSAVNQIVIGSGAVGTGNNTVTIGNDSITATILKGLITAPTTTNALITADATGKAVVTKEYLSANGTDISGKKDISTGNNYKWETTGATGSLQETTVTPSRAVATDANGLPVASATTATELGYVNGVTSGIQAQLNAKTSITGGVVNSLPKYNTTTTVTPSRITDTGTYLGIGTTAAPLKDITIGNQANRDIGIEESSNVSTGRDLTVSAGRTINYAPSEFIAMQQTGIGMNAIAGLVVKSNGDVYAFENYYTAYKKASADANFANIGDLSVGTLRQAAIDISDNIYYANQNNIYKMLSGGSTFSSLGFTARNYYGVTVTPTNDIYCCVIGGDIYKQTGGAGSLDALGQINRNWYGMASHSNGNVYAVADTGIYMQTGGAGNFILVQAIGTSVITCAPNGDVWATGGYTGTFYKQTAGAGSFVSQSSANIAPAECPSLAISPNGSIYVGTKVGAGVTDIWLKNNDQYGTVNLDGGTLRHKAGTGKGTGTSNFEVYTGQKLPSGTDMQISTLRAKIDNEGLMTLPSVTNAIITADSTGKAVVTKEWALANIGGGGGGGVASVTGTAVDNTDPLNPVINTGETIKDEFIYTSSNTFALNQQADGGFAIFVNGRQLFSTQFTTTSNSVTVLDTLEPGDVIIVMYHFGGVTVDISGKADLNSPTFTGTVSGITKTMVGLDDVDNTTDINKPISTATQTALNLKANLASPTFTGNVSLPQTTTINNFSPVVNIIRDTVPSTVITGTISETIFNSYLILANTFAVSDNIKVQDFSSIKTGNLSSSFYRIYVNTSNTLAGAVQVSYVNSGLSNNWSKTQRTFVLNGGTLAGFAFNTSATNDSINSSGIFSSTPFDPTVNNWIITTGKLSNSGDSIQQLSFNITS